MKRSAILYSDTERAWIEARKSMARRGAHGKFVLRFGRKDVSLQNYVALCKRNKWFTGRTGRYDKGNVPHTKGMKMPFNASSARTQFKKGAVPHNLKYAGHERVNVDGYVEISVEEKNPQTGFERRYVHKHRWLWERENGPIPEGMCLKCLDGDKANSGPSNWKCIPRGMLPRLNNQWGRQYDAAPDELRPTIMAVAELEHKAREAIGS
ncbi:hypothetical protein JI58_04285 [Marinosulfonomonas sp. PRT-SC04]|nr:hypothetical protein JI58_05235 [Marinosulfonomonas sp. PRT-SC04]KPU84362.1 hypothetical protein JI58_04285 [Marinosulfonomonas sp. PRT-SC04]